MSLWGRTVRETRVDRSPSPGNRPGLKSEGEYLTEMDQVGWRVLVTTRHSRRGKVVEETSRTVLRQIEEIIFDDEKVENVA